MIQRTDMGQQKVLFCYTGSTDSYMTVGAVLSPWAFLLEMDSLKHVLLSIKQALTGLFPHSNFSMYLGSRPSSLVKFINLIFIESSNAEIGRNFRGQII